MSHNTFGHLFRVTTWGESHGPALGCVVDGCPPGLPLSEAEVQHWLDKRKPGGNRFVTQRREPDQVKILSGVFEDARTGGPVTTGTPISMVIENVDQRSKDYGEIATQFRPGHADYAYFAKYGGARLPRRRPGLGARDGGARRGRRSGPQGAGRRRPYPRRPDPGRAASHRSQPLGLGRDRKQPLLVPRPGHGRPVGRLPRRGAQGGLLHRRDPRGSGPRACPRAGAHLSTANSTPSWPAR
jgi:hypothetical protein